MSILTALHKGKIAPHRTVGFTKHRLLAKPYGPRYLTDVCGHDQIERQKAKTTALLGMNQDMKGLVEDGVIVAISKELDSRIDYDCRNTVMCERDLEFLKTPEISLNQCGAILT